MEYKRPDELHSNIEEDACGIIEEGEICNEKTALSEISKEINQTYVEQLAKLNEQYDSPEVRTKLLYSWIAELLDQNALLVETVSELETAAVHRVALLEDRLQRSSVSVREYVARAQAPDGQSVATLCSLVAQLEADVGSLLELVRRAMRDGRWDLRGLTFHRVAYRDIFGPSSGLPPPAAPKREEPKKPPEYETELRKLTSEVELWKMRAEKAEAEARAAWDTTRPGAERGDLDRPRRLPAETAAEQARAPGPGPDDARQARETGGRETAAADRSEKLQRELDRANGLAAERAEQIRLLTLRLDGTEQRAGAQLGDARRRVLELEGELARAQSGVLVRNRLIQGMRKEMKLYMSQVALQRKKVINFTEYFNVARGEAKDLDRGFEEPDSWDEQLALALPASTGEVPKTKSEDDVVEDAVRLFALAMCELVELAEKVDKAVKETADEARRLRDTHVHNLLSSLKAVKSHGLEVANLRSEVAGLRRALEISQTRLRLVEEEVVNKEEVIMLMTKSAKVHDSMIRERENRIRACENEIASNEDTIKNLTISLADQTKWNRDLREIVTSTRQQLQEL